MSGVLKYTLIVRHPETTIPTALLQGESVPEWAVDLVHKDDLEGGDDGGTPADSTPKPPTKAEMLAEIASRNEGRDEADLIVPDSDKNADLAAALKADDEKSADQ